jgi:hypothetical protein
MKVLQIVPTLGRHCGLAVLADALDERLARAGVDSRLARRLVPNTDADVVLLWFHSDLMGHDDVLALSGETDRALALFVHSSGAESALDAIDGLLAMSPDLAPLHAPLPHVFACPATPEPLLDRVALRQRLGLPTDKRVLGTCGFLRFEREFEEIAARLVPHAEERGWFVQITTSPWHIDSPGVIKELERIREEHPASFGFEYRHLDEAELIHRMQACDLLWCWTRAPSSPYASGVVATQYASGTRLFVADKLQHEQVLGLPNTVRGPATLGEFVAALVAEADAQRFDRHDPEPVSWAGVVPDLMRWLEEVSSGAGRRRGYSAGGAADGGGT